MLNIPQPVFCVFATTELNSCLWQNSYRPLTEVISTISPPLVISSDPQSVAGDHESPCTQLVCFRWSCICKAWADVGVVHRDVLFSSDRTSKESACCFTAQAPQGIRTSGRQCLYLFLCQFVFLPSSWHPPLHPHLFALAGPTQVILYQRVTTAFNPLRHFCSYPKPFCLVSGPESASVIYPVCVPSQPACLHP